MPKHIRAKSQAKSEKSALRKLKSTGLYKGKVDLRRKPTKYQLGLIAKYRDVISGKAVLLKPKDPASYKALFQVVGDKVIVPRRKGEKIKVGKSGAIVGERTVGGRKVRTRFRRVKSDADLSNKPRTMFFVPFIRGKDIKGKPILEWKRFPTKELLLQVMGGYENRDKNPYSNWQDYVIEERIDPAHPYTSSEQMNYRLNKKLNAKKRKRLKFDDDVEDDE